MGADIQADIQIGKSGQDDTSGIPVRENAVSIPQRLDDLEKRADDVIADFGKLEKDIDKFKTLAYFIIGAMAVAFAFTSVLIGLDYFKNNQDRYKELMEKTEEIRYDFYTKKQVDDIIIFSTTQIENQIGDFKKCLKNGGWNRCF